MPRTVEHIVSCHHAASALRAAGKPTLIEQREAAIALVEANLAQCCTELIEWSDTGVLSDGKVREVARLCAFAGHSDLSVAETIIKRLAFEFVVGRDHIVVKTE